MLKGLLGTITSEAERRGLPWLRELAGNGVEHAEQLAGKLEWLGQAGPPPRATAEHELVDAADLVRVAEQLARAICQGRPVVDVPRGGWRCAATRTRCWTCSATWC
jgi:hypothetical protein